MTGSHRLVTMGEMQEANCPELDGPVSEYRWNYCPYCGDSLK